jgi:hypothetical protein
MVAVAVSDGTTGLGIGGDRGSGFAGTRIDSVDQAVAIVVGIRAAVLVCKAVLVFLFIWTSVFCIPHAVVIVVVIDAAVTIFVAVLVFCDFRALIAFVADPIVIRIVAARHPAQRENGTQARIAQRIVQRQFDAEQRRDVTQQ